ncbi:glycoside hydrolase family 16 protein [Amycolatopsis pigmentata]|uniref:Family 16 glycosylhydrolase n=1 Tax=Amycolatopsis pigmentata TaxID=450801 RepID=A0ABW5G7H1_9PSEU
MSFPKRPKRRSLLVIGAAAVAVMTSAGCTTELPGAAAGVTQPRAGQVVDTNAIGMSGANSVRAAATTFSDDFDGAAGADVDSGKWQHETGDGVNNHERQFYTAGTANAALDGDGHLVITAKKENPANYNCWYGSCQYTSARLNTAGKFTQRYGHFEARMKLPRGQGMWPAFWLLGDNIGSAGWPSCGEIDVMENIGREPGTVHGSMHGPGYSGGNPLTAAYPLPGGQSFADDFHTFAVDWSPNAVTFSVDGQAYETRTPADTNGNQWVFDHPFYIILNLAVGGDWPGDPDGNTQFPQQLVVDYVHVSA